MKARISMPAEKPLVLAYGLSAERMAALAGLLEKLGFGWREIQPEQLGLTVETLTGDSLPNMRPLADRPFQRRRWCSVIFPRRSSTGCCGSCGRQA